IYETLRDAIRAEEPVALATVIEGPAEQLGAKLLVRPDQPAEGSLGDPDLDRVVARDTIGELAAGITATRHYGPNGQARQRELSIFIESFAPPPKMIIFGAVDFTAALAATAKQLGYRVTVCDARPIFATAARRAARSPARPGSSLSGQVAARGAGRVPRRLAHAEAPAPRCPVRVFWGATGRAWGEEKRKRKVNKK